MRSIRQDHISMARSSKESDVMRKFQGVIKTNIVGSGCSFEFEVEDDATEKEIEEAAREQAFENIDWYYEEVKESDS